MAPEWQTSLYGRQARRLELNIFTKYYISIYLGYRGDEGNRRHLAPKELGPRTAKLALSICGRVMIPADFMSVVMTSFSKRFLNYDVIDSVIITEIQLL